IQEELSGLQQTITEKIREEDALLGKKQELEKELSETFQKEERNKSEAEKHSFELHSLEVMKGSLEREIESLKQSQGYFYASVEEVMLLTGARFSLEVKEEKEVLEGMTKNQLRDMEHAVERLKLKIEGMQVGNTKEVESEYTSAKEREAFLQNE